MKNETDRTTRLLFTVTLFGGTWYIFRGVINLWNNTFTEIAYTKSIINFEHIISIWILVIMIVITGTVVRYIYYEFKTYQHIPNNEEREKSISNADDAFKDNFKMLKTLAILSLIILILFFFYNFFTRIKLKNILLFTFIGLILVILFKSIIKRKLKDRSKNSKIKLKTITHKLSNMYKRIGLITYLIILVLIVSFSLLVISIESNQEVKVNIGDTQKLPMEIILKNYDNPTLEIIIFREEEPANNISILLEEDDLQKSIIEVYETRTSKENFLLKGIKSANSKTTISNNNYYYKYNLDLEKYILQNKNIMKVYIHNNGNTGKKTVYFATSIYKDGNSINIAQDNFKVNP
ncbi:hypothetical protein [Oceanobacillus picturae]|uniref:hypothetical protein n=1 Tax=Oceanobacillus picturae TaxID=171693 RepID=UPI000E68B376|nr:hypothetical protein [Oceanobacillus picturae]RIU93441.1 hypothetical protein D1864_08220 [Oceanobacillus picturae]